MDATIARAELGLTLREYQVLDYIRSHRPRPVPAAEINDAVFGDYSDRSRARRTITDLRRKLGPHVLVTVAGFGVRYAASAVVEACPRCIQCGRAIARYDDEWVCYACGASGSRARLDLDIEVGRAAYDPTTLQGKPWTEEDLAFIRANRDTMSNAAIAAALNRTESGVRGQSTAMRLGRKRYIKVAE